MTFCIMISLFCPLSDPMDGAGLLAWDRIKKGERKEGGKSKGVTMAMAMAIWVKDRI